MQHKMSLMTLRSLITLLSITALCVGLLPQPSVSKKFVELSNEAAFEQYTRSFPKTILVETVFYLKEEETFLALTDQTNSLKLNYEHSSRTKQNRGKGVVEFMEFTLNNVKRTLLQKYIPMSHCHSENKGQGGEVAMQISLKDSMAVLASLGLLPNFLLQAISFKFKVGLELGRSLSIKVACTIAEGQMGQIFLQNSRFIEWTLKIRKRKFDLLNNKLYKAESPENLVSGKMLEKHGWGELICLQGSKEDLMCKPEESAISFIRSSL